PPQRDPIARSARQDVDSLRTVRVAVHEERHAAALGLDLRVELGGGGAGGGHGGPIVVPRRGMNRAWPTCPWGPSSPAAGSKRSPDAAGWASCTGPRRSRSTAWLR